MQIKDFLDVDAAYWYYKLRGWTLEDHPLDEHTEKEIERWWESLQHPEEITSADKDCPSC